MGEEFASAAAAEEVAVDSEAVLAVPVLKCAAAAVEPSRPVVEGAGSVVEQQQQGDLIV